MGAWATPEQYVLRAGGSLTEDSKERLEALLEDTQAVIESLMPPGCEPPPVVGRAILIKILRRSEANPGGITMRRVGDTQESYDDRGGLYVTGHELDALTSGCPTGGAYTLHYLDVGAAQMERGRR